jgi:hypothetical protein
MSASERRDQTRGAVITLRLGLHGMAQLREMAEAEGVSMAVILRRALAEEHGIIDSPGPDMDNPQAAHAPASPAAGPEVSS